MAYAVKCGGSMFPAPVGMNRAIMPIIAATINVPRACGDEPRDLDAMLKFLKCSPRLWG